MLPLIACAPVPGAEASEEIRVGDQDERMRVVQITNTTVAGPAANLTEVPSINRIGSAVVPVRIYEPDDSWATLVWAHGGSFVRGTLDWPEADWAATRFAEQGIRVLSVDYILATDTVKAPAPSNDVAAVLAWAAAEYDGTLAVGGASAGAHLAVLATHEHMERAVTRDGRIPDALLLEYPTLHRVQRADPELASAVESLPEQRRFRADRIAGMYDYYLGSEARDLTPTEKELLPVAGELPASRLAALPATVIVNADLDELRASGEEFAEQLTAAGVVVSHTLQPGTVHGYLNRPEESARSLSDATATIDRFVSELRRLTAR